MAYGSGYVDALKAAGAKVLGFCEFGDYGGVWLAHVTLPNGCEAYIKGYFGSCSGCDDYEAEFGIIDEIEPEKLADFGRKYLKDAVSIQFLVAGFMHPKMLWSIHDRDFDQAKWLLERLEAAGEFALARQFRKVISDALEIAEREAKQ